MILYTLISSLPIRSTFVKMLLGAALAALIVSLGTVFVMRLMSMDVKPAIPSVLGAVAAAMLAARLASAERAQQTPQ